MWLKSNFFISMLLFLRVKEKKRERKEQEKYELSDGKR
jgi:hypothetical protein